MIKVLSKEIDDEIKGLFSKAQKSITIISPFLSIKTATMLCTQVKNNPALQCSFVTRLYFEDLLCGANSIDAIESLIDEGIKVYSVKGLHTKLYLFDENKAIVGSANFTVSGLKKNIELSVLLDDDEVVTILSDYANSIIEQCVCQEEGTFDKSKVQRIRTEFEEYKHKHDTGRIQRSAKMIGAKLESNEFIRNLDVEKDKKDLLDGKVLSEKDYVHELFNDEPQKVIDSTMKPILKLEGLSFSPDERTIATEVKYNGRRVYILNFPNNQKPTKIIQDTPFFLTRAYKEKGKSVHVIVGRGLCASFDKRNVVREEWVKKYPWMKKKNNYVVIKEMEVLDTPIRNCINLDDEVAKLGVDFYTSTVGKEKTEKQLHQIRCQKPYLFITPKAKNTVDKAFDDAVNEFGSYWVYSQIE